MDYLIIKWTTLSDISQAQATISRILTGEYPNVCIVNMSVCFEPDDTPLYNVRQLVINSLHPVISY